MDEMNKKKEWTFIKHIVFSVSTAIMIELLIFFISIVSPFLPIAMSSKKVNTIGVIGGADGPTAIFVTSAFSGYEIMIIVGLCSLIVLLCLYYPLRRIIRHYSNS